MPGRERRAIAADEVLLLEGSNCAWWELGNLLGEIEWLASMTPPFPLLLIHRGLEVGKVDHTGVIDHLRRVDCRPKWSGQ